MDELLITRNAAELIRNESLKCTVETGGRIFGYPQSKIISKATSPGPNAEKNPASFTDDVSFQKEESEAILKESNGKCKQLGSWHRHPGRFNRPSSGDQQQAREIANDFQGVCSFIALITNVIAKGFKKVVSINAYVFNNKSQSLEHSPITLVDDKDARVIKAQESEPLLLTTRETSFFQDSSFRFHTSLVGKDRLAQEHKELVAADCNVEVQRTKNDDRICLVIAFSEIRLRVLLPIEYPLSPPKVFFEREGRTQEIVTLSLLHWSSDQTLLNVVEDSFQVLDNSHGRLLCLPNLGAVSC